MVGYRWFAKPFDDLGKTNASQLKGVTHGVLGTSKL